MTAYNFNRGFEFDGSQPSNLIREQVPVTETRTFITNPSTRPKPQQSLYPLIREEFREATTTVSYTTYVIYPSRVMGAKIAGGIAGLAFAFGVVYQVPLVETVMIAGSVGLGGGFLFCAGHQAVQDARFLEHFAERIYHLREYANPQQLPAQEPEKKQESELKDVVRPTTVERDPNGRTRGTKISRYRFVEEELRYLASICLIGSKVTRDSLRDNQPQYLKETGKWKNFNSKVWPSLRHELEHIQWVNKFGLWTKISRDWFISEGFKVPALAEND